MRKIFLTALAPIFWGSTYIITTEFLPGNHPLLVAAIRALPVGLLIMIRYRIFPKGIWWWRSLVLGGLNFSLFFAFHFMATYRLDGGIAATIGAIQPILVILFSWHFFGERPLPSVIPTAALGCVGVGFLVLDPSVHLDWLGVAAAIGASLAMAAGNVLTKHWGRPVPLIVFTGWQLTAGGLALLLAAFFAAGELPVLAFRNLFGFSWLTLLNTGLAYVLWFKGIEQLKVWQVSSLGLLSPIVAVFIGLLLLGQTLSPLQFTGILLAFFSLIGIQRINYTQGSSKQSQIPGIMKSSRTTTL